MSGKKHVRSDRIEQKIDILDKLMFIKTTTHPFRLKYLSRIDVAIFPLDYILVKQFSAFLYFITIIFVIFHLDKYITFSLTFILRFR